VGESLALRQRPVEGSNAAIAAVAGGVLLLAFIGCAAGPRSRVAWDETTFSRPPLDAPSENSFNPEDLPFAVLVGKGKESLDKEDLAVAEYYFVAALNKEPHSEAALTGLGEVLQRRGKFDEADATFRRALQTTPDSVAATVGLGRVCRDRGDDEEALQHLRRAAQLAPDDPTVLGELALTYQASNDDASAEALFQVVVDKTGSAEAYNNLGFSRLLQRRYSDAVPPLEKAVSLAPGDSRVRNNLAVAYAMTGRSERAYRLFENTLGKAAAYNNLGYLYMIQGRRQEAEAALRSAMEASPAYYVRAGENQDRLGEFRQRHATQAASTPPKEDTLPEE
jgi:Flp pilus assembly protein TadD